jgi:membrane protease YdiL (CAAX protease family)
MRSLFSATFRPLMLAMLAVACVLAPIYEEMFFRGVLYRACRQRLGRPIALILSSVLFGILHTNAAGFLSLTLLGGVLAVAYEYTGDIRVPILAHGIFNLNTLVIVLSGLPQI